MPDDPIHIPQTWTRVAGIDIRGGRFSATFAAYDRGPDVVYLYDEIDVQLGALPVHAEAVRARGKWIPALFDIESGQREHSEGVAIAHRLSLLGIDLLDVEASAEVAVADIEARLSTGRLRVWNTCQKWLAQYRRLRRDEEGELDDADAGLIRATGLIVGPGLGVAKSEALANSDAQGYDMADSTRNETTGY